MIDPDSPQYSPLSTLLSGVKSGKLHQGHFNASQYNYLEARTIESHLPEFCLTPHAGQCLCAGLLTPSSVGREGTYEPSGSRRRGRN